MQSLSETQQGINLLSGVQLASSSRRGVTSPERVPSEVRFKWFFYLCVVSFASSQSPPPSAHAAGGHRENLCADLAVLAFFVVGLWLNGGKELWLDELFTWYQVSDKTLAELFDATATGFNLIPAGHFLLLWGLDQMGVLVPDDARLISLTAMAGGLLLLSRLWRRLWGSEVALILVGVLVGSSTPLLAMAVEVRPYALGFFLAVLALRCALALQANPGHRRAAWWNGVLSFALPFVSYPAGLFSAALFAVQFAQDGLRRKTPSAAVVISYLAGWTLFLLVGGRTLLGQIELNPAGLGKLSPRLVDLLGTYAALVAFPLGIAVTLALAKFVDGRSEESFAAQQKTQPVHSLPLAFVAWLLVPVVFFILANARIATVWGERFILPTAVAIVSMAGPALNDSLRQRRRLGRWLALGMLGVSVASLVATAVSFHKANGDTPVNRLAREIAEIAGPLPQVPWVISEMNTFFHFLHYGDQTRDLRLYAATPANQALLGRVSRRLHPIVEEDILRLPRFVMLVDSDPAWADKLRGQFAQRHLTVNETHKLGNEFIQEIWVVERSPVPGLPLK